MDRRKDAYQMERIIDIPHLKGDATSCDNYRKVALMDIAYKVMVVAIKSRLNETVESEIRQYQCGFRKDRLAMH